MSNSFEKSVKGGTKVKLAAPKSKYVEHILMATQSGEAGVAEVFRTLTHRLRDSTWTVAFKSLIIVHLMIKEGARDVTLSYLSVAPRNRLAINTFTDVQTQGHNIRRYSEYLLSRAGVFATTKCDYARADGRLRRMSVSKGLLRETDLVQGQIKELLKCDLLTHDGDNEISLTAFRLLTRDLLDLYNVENEGMLNILTHYFEMSKTDAERSVKIYKRFCTQTDQVVQFLGVARQYEHATRLEIPKIKHAPTSLAKSLQDYLDDTDFEVNRRQYLAEQEGKASGRPFQKPAPVNAPTPKAEFRVQETPQNKFASASVSAAQPPRGPAPDLIDFFESIEQNQQPMAQFPQQNSQVQENGFVGQQGPVFQQPQSVGFGQDGFAVGGTNPFLQQQQAQQQFQQQQQAQQQFQQQQQAQEQFQHQQLQQPQFQQQPANPQLVQPQFTGAGFGGYGPQPQQSFDNSVFAPQQYQQPFSNPNQVQSPGPIQSPVQMQTPQQTGSSNPFRQSTMPIGADALPFAAPQRANTNPFARSAGTPPVPPVPTGIFTPTPPPQLLQAQSTGTNPFAKMVQPSQAPTPPLSNLQVQPTGSTNPFRQSAFVNQATGTGWQNAPQGTMGGFESFETVPVFPRPGQAPAPQQQQQQSSPWG